MWRVPPITAQNLKRIVREAPTDAEIRIPPGEYEGPFVIDRPLRLIGNGDSSQAVTFWTRRGPAIIVRCSGVTFTSLSIEVTLPEARQTDATIWYQSGCRPDTQGAQIQGRIEEMGKSQKGNGWNLPNIIDLGNLRAKYPVSLPMVIQVPEAAQLRSDLKELIVQPAILPSGGEYPIYVSISRNQLEKDTLLAGQLVVECGGDTRSVWIIGQVLNDNKFKPWITNDIILLSKSGRKIGCSTGLLVGKEQFQGEPGGDRLAEKQAYIFKEPSGVWSLIQPLPVKTPTILNGQSLDVGQRRLLKGGETIEIGSLHLTVDTKKTRLPVTVDGLVDFGKLSSGHSKMAVIKVKNNNRVKKWQGTLRSTVPWIQVPTSQVDCLGNQTTQVTVELGSGISNLPLGEINYTGALILEGQKESWVISAKLNVDVEGGLEVEPNKLDFGHVSDPNLIAPQLLRVRNTGTSDWQGTVQVVAPWIRVDETSLHCPPGTETTLKVSLTDEVANLSEGVNRIAEALKINGQGLSLTVPVEIYFDKPKVQLDVQPKEINWGQVGDWRGEQAKTILLRNTGTKNWQGRVISKVDWIEVEPANITCAAQAQTSITIRLTEQFQNLSIGKQRVPAAIRIEGEGIANAILVQADVRAPEIKPDTAWIDLVTGDDANPPQYQLVLKNKGSQDWQGTVKAIRWLDVSPVQVTCLAGGEATIEVSLGDKARIFKPGRKVEVADAIRIEGSGLPVLVGVRLKIVERYSGRPGQRTIQVPDPAKVKPTDKPVDKPTQVDLVQAPPDLTVDFGIISSGTDSLPSQEVSIQNTQPWPINGTALSNVPWVDLTPSTFSCAPGKEVILTAKLNSAAISLSTGKHDILDALIIRSGGKILQGRAILQILTSDEKVSEPQVEEQVENSPLEMNFGQVDNWSEPLPMREIRLHNSRSETMSGSVTSTLPWLTATPTRFSCPPGQDVILSAKLTLQGKKLRPKVYNVADALIIESNNQKHLVRVQLEIITPSSSRRSVLVSKESGLEQKRSKQGEKPSASDLGINFGIISDWSGKMPVEKVRINNSRKQEVHGTIQSTLPWLAVSPTSYSCAPGQEIMLTVKLTKAATRLRPKRYDVADALIIESNGERRPIRAQLEIARQGTHSRKERSDQGKTTVNNFTSSSAGLFVDFGTVSEWTDPLPTQEVHLTNSQPWIMKGVVQSTVPWLRVTPTKFSCASGQEVALTVSLASQAKALQAKTYDIADALVIDSGSKKHLVRAKIKINPPDKRVGKTPPKAKQKTRARRVGLLKVEPESIDFKEVKKWRDSLPMREVKVINGRKTAWKGRVKSTVPWLEVSPTEVKCAAGESVSLQIRLTKHGANMRSRSYSASDAIIIEGSKKTFLIKVAVTIG